MAVKKRTYVLLIALALPTSASAGRHQTVRIKGRARTAPLLVRRAPTGKIEISGSTSGSKRAKGRNRLVKILDQNSNSVDSLRGLKVQTITPQAARQQPSRMILHTSDGRPFKSGVASVELHFSEDTRVIEETYHVPKAGLTAASVSDLLRRNSAIENGNALAKLVEKHGPTILTLADHGAAIDITELETDNDIAQIRLVTNRLKQPYHFETADGERFQLTLTDS